MWIELLKWAGEQAPSILAIVFSGFIIWKIAQFYFTRFSHTERIVSDLHTKSNDLPCVSHKENIDKLSGQSTQFSHLSKVTDDMRLDISFIKGMLEVAKPIGTSLTQSHSPISLTDKGREIAQEIKAETMIDENWETIFTILENNIPDKNAYDIQEYIMRMVAVEPEKVFDPISLSTIKTYAFKQGTNLLFYSSMFGVIIRDKYLSIKGIDVSEVDANDPAKV